MSKNQNKKTKILMLIQTVGRKEKKNQVVIWEDCLMAFAGCQATWQPQQDFSESSNWAEDECYQFDPAVQN